MRTALFSGGSEVASANFQSGYLELLSPRCILCTLNVPRGFTSYMKSAVSLAAGMPWGPSML
jgi:hypothetical protein